MNELSELDTKLIERIREAELDPVPQDVLAAARRAIGCSRSRALAQSPAVLASANPNHRIGGDPAPSPLRALSRQRPVLE
jgi:hypothetical protein